MFSKITAFLLANVIATLIIVTSPLLLNAKSINNIPAPDGYSRISYKRGTYNNWITRLPIKNKNIIRLYNGKILAPNFYRILAVVDMPILFKQNLEQCADYCFRLWGEYHRQNNLLNRLYLLNYSGKKRYFKKSRKSFKGFLKWSFAYSNSHSIKMGCASVSKDDLQPGDMVVQNRDGGIGHVSIILAVCRLKDARIQQKSLNRLYLIGYSFMPAQEFHIENSDKRFGKAGWFTIEGYIAYLEEHFDFGKPVFRRF